MRYAVILAGGGGHRLWPASRRSRPKQFLALGAAPDLSLLGATRGRLEGLCPAEHIVVVTAAEQAEMVRAELSGLAPENLLAEPAARNTAAALGLAATHLVRRHPEAVLAALPADHYIADEAGFRAVAARAFALAAARDVIVTIGVVPTRAEVGFGYLERGAALTDAEVPGAEVAYQVERFVEKPNAADAARYLASGRFFWNAGMFFVKARVLLDAIGAHLPETKAGLDAIGAALDANPGVSGLAAAEQVAAEVYPGLPAISIDHGVMERASGVVTIPGSFGWNDVGSWAALGDYRPADEHGNVTQGQVVCHDARDNIVVGDGEHAIAVIGAEGLVVVQAGNAVLVVPRERAQDVRAAVAMLRERGLSDYL